MHTILYFSYIRLLTRKCTFYLSLVSFQVPYFVNVALCVRIPHVACLLMKYGKKW